MCYNVIGDSMKVLSIKNPWASLIINGYKKYEFRSWKTKYRGKVMIHASITPDKKAIDKFDNFDLNYKNSYIIGEVEIIDCIEVTKEFENKLMKENGQVYGMTVGRGGYAWKLENVIKYENPIPAKGKLGLWEYKNTD